jgi:hypothetical protein
VKQFFLRSGKMKKTMLISIMVSLMVCIVPFAAAATTFDFAGLEDPADTSDWTKISELLTGVYGSGIEVEDAEIRDNDDGDPPAWETTANWDNFLRVQTTWSNDMEIAFLEVPISKASGDGYAFTTEAVSDPDFKVAGYGKNFGSMEDPQNEINSQGVWTGDGHDAPFSIEFDEPVYLLVFSGLGVDETVGIDNLTVESVSMPVPGAFALTGIGASLVGWMRRKKMIS